MRVTGARDVLRGRTELHRNHRFRDEVSRQRPEDVAGRQRPPL
jgi:hypothetical protein